VDPRLQRVEPRLLRQGLSRPSRMNDYGHGWTPPEKALPEKGQAVVWIPPGGGTPVTGTYQGVWLMDNGVYVYYTPLMWAPLK